MFAITLRWNESQTVENMPEIGTVEFDPLCVVKAMEQFRSGQRHLKPNGKVSNSVRRETVNKFEILLQMLSFIMGKPND